MQPIKNAKDPNVTTRYKVISIGEIGSGKTSQFRTLPGKKFAYLFDPNAATALAGSDVDYVEFIADKDDIDLAVKLLKKEGERMIGDKPRKKIEAKTYVEWEDDFEERIDSGFFDEYDWIMFDSATTFGDIIMDRVLQIAGRLGKHPEQPDWTSQMTTMRNVFRQALSLDCSIYLTCHSEVVKDDVTGKLQYQIMMTGKNRIRIPLMFSDIFYLEGDDDKGKVRYTARTVQDRQHPISRVSPELRKKMDNVQDITIDWTKNEVGQGLGQFFVDKKADTKAK